MSAGESPDATNAPHPELRGIGDGGGRARHMGEMGGGAAGFPDASWAFGVFDRPALDAYEDGAMPVPFYALLSNIGLPEFYSFCRHGHQGTTSRTRTLERRARTRTGSSRDARRVLDLLAADDAIDGHSLAAVSTPPVPTPWARSPRAPRRSRTRRSCSASMPAPSYPSWRRTPRRESHSLPNAAVRATATGWRIFRVRVELNDEPAWNKATAVYAYIKYAATSL